MRIGDADGVHFAVWAPNADRVSVVGDFNAWDGRLHPMRRLGPTGIWEIFIPGLSEGGALQVRDPIEPSRRAAAEDRSLRIRVRGPPLTASVVARLDYAWNDAPWLIDRAGANAWLDKPMATYEVHLGSWMRVPGGAGSLSNLRGAGGAAHPLREGDGLHAHRAAAGDGAPVLGLVGLSRSPASTRPPAASARRATSRRSSTRATRPASASSSTGCRATFRRTRTGSRASTAPRSSSTRTRCRGSSATGARSSSTTGATRCATSSSRTRCSGSRSTTSTACAWTRWRRCCTWISRSTPGTGCRTSSAAARTSRRSTSSASSTR